MAVAGCKLISKTETGRKMTDPNSNSTMESGGCGPGSLGMPSPKSDETGDVEFFINNFKDVSIENGWNDGAAVLHLSDSMKDDAVGCSKARSLAGLYENLMARYSITPNKARAQLTLL